VLRNGKNVDKKTILAADYNKFKKPEECGIFQLLGLPGAILTREM